MVGEATAPKFPQFRAYLHSKGLDMLSFSEILLSEGYKQYNYATVRRKLVGESKLNFDDIIIFSKVAGVDESIFFS